MGSLSQKEHLNRAYEDRMGKAIAWFGLGLGLIQLTTPRRLSAVIGAPSSQQAVTTQRVVGLREIASAGGILIQSRPVRWLQGRVAGDLVDLALIGAALSSKRADRGRLALTAGAVAGVTCLDVIAARRAARSTHGTILRSVRSITIRRSPHEVYDFWRNFEQAPRFMAHLESVEVLDDARSRWVVKTPLGSARWTAEVTEDRPGECLAWQSLPDSDLTHSGRVIFRPAPRDQGTEVTASVQYEAPGGTLGAKVAHLLGREPGQQVGDNLRRLKQILETGELARSDASPWGIDRAQQRHQRAGQPRHHRP